MVVSQFGDVYPELKEKEAFVMGVIKDEEEAFSSMLVSRGEGGASGNGGVYWCVVTVVVVAVGVVMVVLIVMHGRIRMTTDPCISTAPGRSTLRSACMKRETP